MAPSQTAVLPLIAPGCAGAEDDKLIVNVRAVLLPQPLLAVTEMLPPALFAVVVIEFVVELPVHPEGSVQV